MKNIRNIRNNHEKRLCNEYNRRIFYKKLYFIKKLFIKVILI